MGDTLVVWKLDRLGRSLTDLVKLVNGLNQRQIGLKSLSDPIDTTTSQGRFVFNIFASLAELERDIIKERKLSTRQIAKRLGISTSTLYDYLKHRGVKIA